MSADPHVFNVFADAYDPSPVREVPGERREMKTLYQSADGRVVMIAAHYPDGARFTYGADAVYRECFYVVEGTGRRRHPDGTELPISTGDCIYAHPGVDVEYVYDPGLRDLGLFWRDDGPLPDFLTALVPQVTDAPVP